MFNIYVLIRFDMTSPTMVDMPNQFLYVLYIYIYIYIYSYLESIIANVLGCGHQGNKFEYWRCYYVHFWTNNFGLVIS